MTGRGPILETRGLAKRFGGVTAVAGVDFRLDPGELRCLIGPNGAGKSTFFKMLTGQLRPTSGAIRWTATNRRRAAARDRPAAGSASRTRFPTS